MASNEYVKILLDKNIITKDVANQIIDYNNRLTAANLPIIYNLKHIRKIFNISKGEQCFFFGNHKKELYRYFYIPKKSGGTRLIEAPSDRLKEIQSWINDNILSKINISDNAKGFKKNCSIYDNAIKHVGKELVINIDLENFFPSIKYSQIIRMFVYLGYNNDVSHLLTQLCTNNKNVLPQGAPTSPALSNIVCLKLDKRLSSLANKFNFTYTRYADDMTFSGDRSIKGFLPIIRSIIENEGYTINEKKLRLQYNNQRQSVTGLVVNKKVNISPNLKREIDNAIYYCQKFGVDEHMHKIGCDKSFYKEHLYGIAYFVKMIDRNKGEWYLKELDKIAWSY